MEENNNPTPPAGGVPQEPAPAPAAPAPNPGPANPFAAQAAASPAPAEPAAAAAPQEPAAAQQTAAAQQAPVEPQAPQPAAPQAAAPVQPYAVWEPAPAQPTAQPAWGAYDRAYGAESYQAVPPVPPVPPAAGGAPVYGYEPPASSGQKRRWPWFLLGLAVGLVIGLGGCVSCAGVMALTAVDGYDSYRSDSYGYDYDYGYDYGHGYDSDDPYHTWPPEDDYDPYGESEGATTLALTYDEVTRLLEADGIAAGTPGADGACAKGYYTVGPDGDIPAGLYYLEGGDALSHYYLFDSESETGKGNAYDLDDSVQYLGNYFAELDEGDLIAFEPGVDGAVMRPAPSTALGVTAPYGSGCYRVGVDIPAGTYTITALPLPEGIELDEGTESAAYVMDDLDFDEDSIVDTQYVITGGKQTVTVTNGQYLELFAAQAVPADADAATPAPGGDAPAADGASAAPAAPAVA